MQGVLPNSSQYSSTHAATAALVSGVVLRSTATDQALTRTFGPLNASCAVLSQSAASVAMIQSRAEGTTVRSVG